MDTQLVNRSKALQLALGATATLAGLDKFFNLLADWPTYLSPFVANMVPISADVLMQIVGIIEIGVGFCILFAAPILGTYAASAWLLVVAVNLIIAGHFDVAVRDVVLAIAALNLVRSLELRAIVPASEQAVQLHRQQALSS